MNVHGSDQVKAMLLVWGELWEGGFPLGDGGRFPHKNLKKPNTHPPPSHKQANKLRTARH